MRFRNILLIAMAMLVMSSVAAFAGHHEEKQTKRHYPLDTCFVSGEALDEYAISMDIDGREVKVCCKSCVKKVNTDPKAYMAKLDKAIIAQQDKHYPLTTCPISGGKLGSMGEPDKIVVDNYLIKLCCAGCEKSIKKDPAPTLDKLSAYWETKASGKGCATCAAGLECAACAAKKGKMECAGCADGKTCAACAAKKAEKECAGCADGKTCTKCEAKKAEKQCCGTCGGK